MEKAVKSQIGVSARLSVAPMMDWTDRHCRFLHRQISRHVLLYTEMITAAALTKGDARHLLRFDEIEHPVALQLGGSDPSMLAEASRIGVDHGYDEINLNVGCPSDRVQSGAFGACLMLRPDCVAACVTAMQAAVPDVPVTVKCRIGVDDQEPDVTLPLFLETLRSAGCQRITIHARKAWLEGLSPKQNRDIPPLDYDLVDRMNAQFPDLALVLNGGLTAIDQVEDALCRGLAGAMIGRAAYATPMAILGDADRRIFGDTTEPISDDALIGVMCAYAERERAAGARLHQITRHMLGLFAGRPGARRWKQVLSAPARGSDPGPELIERAYQEVLDRAA